MLPLARIEHAMPGRLRLRIPEMRGDVAYFDGLEQSMRKLDGIGSVTARPATGSILLEDLELGPSILSQTSLEHGWFQLAEGPEKRPRGSGAGWSEPLSDGLSLGAVRPSLIFVLLALAAVQATRGQVMVPALTLLWFAFELSRRRDPASATATRAPAGHSVH